MLKRAKFYTKQCLAVVFGLSARKGVYEIELELCIFSLQLDGGIMLFNVEKLMGIIACIMKRMDVKSINYMKVIKLMYLSDRLHIDKYDSSISNDEYYSMPHGPVLSRLYNLIMNESCDKFQKEWDKFFLRDGYDIAIRDTSVNEKILELSRAEENTIGEIVDKYGKMDKWDLVNNVAHKLPEWEDPQGSSIPLPLRKIMEALGKDKKEIDTVLAEREIYEKEFA